MMKNEKKRLLMILAVVVAAAVLIAAFVHQKEEETISDPAEIAGMWHIDEDQQTESDDGPAAIMIAIDKNGGYRLWNYDQNQNGKLNKKEDKLYFEVDGGKQYTFDKKNGKLIVTLAESDPVESWTYERTGDYGDTQLTDQERLAQYAAIQKAAMDFEDLDYGVLYESIVTQVDLMGSSEGDAIAAAKKGFIEKMAFDWYAKENEIVVTEKQVDQYMDDLIADAKETDDFKNMEAAYKKAGMTFEESIRCHARSYRYLLITDQFYEEHEKDWEAFKDTVVDQYKRSQDFPKMQEKLNRDIEKIKKDL